MPRALHFMAQDPEYGSVPACWDGRWSFTPGQLTPFVEHVDCRRCLQRLAVPATLPAKED